MAAASLFRDHVEGHRNPVLPAVGGDDIVEYVRQFQRAAIVGAVLRQIGDAHVIDCGQVSGGDGYAGHCGLSGGDGIGAEQKPRLATMAFSPQPPCASLAGARKECLANPAAGAPAIAALAFVRCFAPRVSGNPGRRRSGDVAGQPPSKAAPGPSSRQPRGRRSIIEIDAQVQVGRSHVMVAHLSHDGPDRNVFRRDRSYWVDLSLTPRRPNATGRFDRWPPGRSLEIGPLIAFPPGKPIEIRTTGGRHVSLICELDADEVNRWLPDDFEWSDRRLEAALNVASEEIHGLLMRLYDEVKNPGVGSEALFEALVTQLSIALARYYLDASAPDTKGGLAPWRMRLVDDRMSDPKERYPTVAELALLCRLSVRQFSRAFKVSRGCSANEFLRQNRMNSAKRRLFSRQSLAEVAQNLGFASQSSFTAAFKRATGATPAEFRKRSVGA